MHSGRDKKGIETIEFVGIFPLVILTLLIIWQLMLTAHTVIIAASAAREGARAAVVDKNPYAAVEQASSGRAEVVSITGGEMKSVKVRARIPKINLPLIGNLPDLPYVYQTATMRYESPYSP
jgi:hypothetical protein